MKKFLKKLVKSISRSDGFRGILCWIAFAYIWLCYKTTRWEIINGHIPQKFWDEDKPFILSFWHGRILIMPYCWNFDRKVNMLISQHRDGQLIAKTIGHIGVDCIQGSSSKGGATALRTMLKALKNGESIGITPDGPRGPRMLATPGVINLAKLSGVPILPCSVGMKSRKHLGSWDRFCLALPFTTGVFLWEEPIYIPKKASKEELAELQDHMEDVLIKVQNRVDELTGHPPVEAA
ncbi:lysophospholipid acyltransferase family protein [Terasakiella sp. A23]|uniref:lysophospholipid acyltransferase family protein n=1 Tax=Terasakiella sp. FCG-A23 TaxID=3080561 RepID=UPI002953D5AF|nr:lysophospholipid acyltransferase family protein [Terasakiella sp. A23]MDV7338024.1 lysophospholipid acyltransferase family protein [Terasakiella sp. A23]